MAVHMLDADVAEVAVAVAGAVEARRPAPECGSAIPRMTVSSIDAIATATSPSPAPSPGRVIGGRAGGAVGRAVACAAGSRREGYRLGRWERLAMTIVVAAALVIAAISMARPAAPATRLVTVLPGDTMTSLVLREAPDMNVARAAELVEELNGLSRPALTPGMRLAVPANG